MNRLVILIFMMIISCGRCSKEEVKVIDIKDERGIYTSKSYLWHLPLGNTQIGPTIETSVIYNNLVLMATEGKRDDGILDDDDFIVAVNIYSGKIEWKVRTGDKYQDDFIADYIYQYGRYVVIKRYSIAYCIDMEKGEVIWTKKWNELYFEHEITGIEDKFFVSASKDGEYKDLYEGDVKTGELKLLLKAKFPHDGSEHIIKYPITKEFYGYKQVYGYRNEKGELMLLTMIQNSLDGKKGMKDYFSLYNYDIKKWQYRYKEAEAIPYIYMPKVVKGRIYYRGGGGFICHDIETGKKIWKTKGSFDQPFSQSTISEGKLIAASGEDMLVCYDLATGNELWRTAKGMGGNNASKMYVLNGIVYFTAGSLHAVDINTGKYIWTIYSPDKSFDSGAFLKREIWVVPGKDGKKGRVITSSYRSGICYEAIR